MKWACVIAVCLKTAINSQHYGIVWVVPFSGSIKAIICGDYITHIVKLEKAPIRETAAFAMAVYLESSEEVTVSSLAITVGFNESPFAFVMEFQK